MKAVLIFLFSFYCCSAAAQTVGSGTEQQLEAISEALEEETEDDAYLQQLDYFAQHPLNINTVTAEELQVLKILSPLQVYHIIKYRAQLGPFIDVYELQAVPTLDVATIKKLLPFISVTISGETFVNRFKGGEHTLLTRLTQQLEKGKGYTKTLPTHYAGSPQRLLLRYGYRYKNVLQWGLVGDKDAGEPFRNKGFDFYSFHLFARQIGKIKSLAIGDFTVNMGQGLVQWQALAFGKSAEAVAIARQAPVLQPYRSAGEFYFSRGAGITMQQGRWEATVFASVRQLSGNETVDTTTNEVLITSFNTAGLHRTENERSEKANTRQLSYGGNVQYKSGTFKIGFNAVQHHFSARLQKRNEPYNAFAISGSRWANASVDYSYVYKNMYLFGEAAVDQTFEKAFINGLVASVHPNADVSLVHRSIAPAYNTLYGNAFTENTLPGNERGLYAGLALRPAAAWRLNAYADVFYFPFIKYRVNAPSRGRDYSLQLTYTPNKQWEIYGRYHLKEKEQNSGDGNNALQYVVFIPKQNLRLHMTYKVNAATALKARLEAVTYSQQAAASEKGLLVFVEGARRLTPQWSGNARLQYFATDGYNSRIYAYESDVLYSYSIPAFFDEGLRYYLNLHWKAGRHFTVWMRWAQTIFKEATRLGTGLDEVEGNKRTEVKLQLRATL